MTGRTFLTRSFCKPTRKVVVLTMILAGSVCGAARGQDAGQSPAVDAALVSADLSQEWRDEDGRNIALLRGRCRIDHGETRLTADRAVVVRTTLNGSRKGAERISVYLEENVRIDEPGRSVTEPTALVSFEAADGAVLEVDRSSKRPGGADPLYKRAVERIDNAARNRLTQTQYVEPDSGGGVQGPELRTVQLQPAAGPTRRVRIFSRNGAGFTFQSFRSEKTTPPEQVVVISGGVNALITGVDGAGPVALSGPVDLSADRMVIWTQADDGGGDDFQANFEQSSNKMFTVYMEGNIEILQGNTKVRASRAVYDARDDRALILDAELRSYVPELQGDVRVRAERIRQLSRDRFHAQNAWTTASQFGKPGYRLQATDVLFENRYLNENPWLLGGGPRPVDPETGRPIPTPFITSRNNTVFIDDIPILSVPYVSAPAEDPNIPLRRVKVGSDRIFGGQLRTTWDMFQLLGLEEPDGVRWDLLGDVFTERGPAIGSEIKYQGVADEPSGRVYFGESLGYYIHDDGEDNLGRDRQNLAIENDDRYRLTGRHRHELPYNLTVIGELGLISDRNFLEQYWENEFDEGKDLETLIYAKQQVDNAAWTILGRPQLNEFENTTQWLPKADLYVLSEPLFHGAMTWSTHTSAGFGKLEPADAPSDPTDVFAPLPYVSDSDGAVLMTRHEIDAPFSLGAVNVVPYAQGEAAFWSEDFNQQQIDRFVGTLGIRSSLMLWKVFPYVQSDVFNLNGLAHKNVFELGYAYTDATENLNNIPQYNEIDDNAQERFRQRFFFNTFGGNRPPTFDPRFYAVRTGAGHDVTSPYFELVDDQSVVRAAWRQRLQTKVGPPERLRIKDWMTLDLEAAFFPNKDRDNFGEDFGLLNADYRWNIGERTTLFANATYDLFDNAQQLWDVGFVTQRSLRGSFYLGLRQVKGANLDSQILTASYSYKMSPKWISTAATAYDVREGRNAGQSLTVTRIGGDFLFHVGANFDGSKNNAGIALAVEPRFGGVKSGRSTQLSSLLGGP